METQPKALVVFSTCDSEQTARGIARHLVEQGVAACVNIVPGITSIYRWKGAVEEAAEWLLVIKTGAGRFDELRTELARVHPYEVPELIALPVVDGLPAYLDWLGQESRLS